MGAELVKWRYSTTAGSAGNSTAQGVPDESLGKYVSTTEWTGTSANNLFDNQLSTDQIDGIVDYRCVFVANLNGTIALRDPTVYLPSTLPTQSTIEIGLDPYPASSLDSGSDQAVTVADENTAPVGVTFSQPTTAAAGLPVGDLEIGTCRAIWVRRTPSGAATASGESFIIRLSGTLTP